MNNLNALDSINTVPDFRRSMNSNVLIKELPVQIKDAVLKKDITVNIAKELAKSGDKQVMNKAIEIINRKKNYDKNIVKYARLAVTKTKLMREKLSMLERLTSQGIILSSIWDIGRRDNSAGDSDFYGNAPTQVVEQCVLRLTKMNDLVLDAMAGSGTTIDVCKQTKRKCIAYDLNPKRNDIIQNNSIKIPLKDQKVDFIFFHPPYLNMVKYSNNDTDLSTMELDKFLDSMETILLEYKRVLKNGKYIAILVGDIVRNGKFIPLSRRIAELADKIGLEDCGYAVKLTSNSVSQRVRGKTIYAEVATTRNLKINHDIVMFWRKPGHSNNMVSKS